jgi:hypothetical protein
MYTTKQRIKDQVLLNTGKYILHNIKNTQETVEQACKILWRTSDDLLKQFRMETLADLEKTRTNSDDNRRCGDQKEPQHEGH